MRLLRLGIALCLLSLVSCGPKSSTRPGANHAVSRELPCDESRSQFIVPSYVDARSCVPREEVETLVRHNALRAIPVRAATPDEPDPSNPSSLYLRVEIAEDQSGYQTHVDAVSREGRPGYGGTSMSGFVTVERVYRDKTLPDAMMRCELSSAGCRGRADVRGAWCTDLALEPGLQALRIVAAGAPPVELQRPEQSPQIEAYYADSPDGRLLVQVRADPGPFAMATVRIDHLQRSPLYRVPIVRKDELDCFHDLRGTSHFKYPVSAAVITPFSWQALGPAAEPLPEARSSRARFGPVRQSDFDLLLTAHGTWLHTRDGNPLMFERGNWRGLRVSRIECPDRPTTPARANLDGVDLAGLNLHRKRLQRASLRDAGLVDADLDESQFCGANFSDADMRRAHALTIGLHDATLDRVDARRADLWGDMEGSKWRGADMREANLGGLLAAADFANADLRGARVYGDLSRASFQGARLEGVRFAGADLRSSLGLTQAQLDAACAEAETQLPTGLHIASCD